MYGRSYSACNCAVVFRENNNILGIYACLFGRPPLLIKYLVDQQQPADDIQISADGLTYIVSFKRFPIFNMLYNSTTTTTTTTTAKTAFFRRSLQSGLGFKSSRRTFWDCLYEIFTGRTPFLKHKAHAVVANYCI